MTMAAEIKNRCVNRIPPTPRPLANALQMHRQLSSWLGHHSTLQVAGLELLHKSPPFSLVFGTRNWGRHTYVIELLEWLCLQLLGWLCVQLVPDHSGALTLGHALQQAEASPCVKMPATNASAYDGCCACLPVWLLAAVLCRMASQPMASRAGGATVRPGEGRSVSTTKSSCC